MLNIIQFTTLFQNPQLISFSIVFSLSTSTCFESYTISSLWPWTNGLFGRLDLKCLKLSSSYDLRIWIHQKMVVTTLWHHTQCITKIVLASISSAMSNAWFKMEYKMKILDTIFNIKFLLEIILILLLLLLCLDFVH